MPIKVSEPLGSHDPHEVQGQEAIVLSAIGAHFEYLVIGAFALFAIVVGYVSIEEALTRR